jgi:HD-like signal output (HDOD) protein
MLNEELWYGEENADRQAEGRAAASLAARVGRILGAKPFPASALRLAKLTKDPRCNIDDLQCVLETDPALSARLLRLVNSAGFALRTECTSVRHAAALVGNSRLNQIATTAAIIDMYDSSAKHAARILEHATVVGALSRYLAYYLALPADELFTCGFLHDIGKLMLLDTDGTSYEELLDAAGQEPDAIHPLERAAFGFDHAMLAGHVLANWSIPDPVPQVVAWHHNAAHAFNISPQIGQMVSALRLADGIAYAYKSYYPEEEIERLAKTDAASYLDVSEPQLAAMWDEMAALAMRVARSSRSGAGLPETFSVRPSAASLQAVRTAKRPSGSRSIPAAGGVKTGRPSTAQAGESSRATSCEDQPGTDTSSSGTIPAIVLSAAPPSLTTPATAFRVEGALPSNVVILEMPSTASGAPGPTIEAAPESPRRDPAPSVLDVPQLPIDRPPPEDVDEPRSPLASERPDEPSPSEATATANDGFVAYGEQTEQVRAALPAAGSASKIDTTPVKSIDETSRGSGAGAASGSSSAYAPGPANSSHAAEAHEHQSEDNRRPTRLQPSPVTSLHPELAADSPRQFACIVCNGPTFAATCGACGSYVCPEHQSGREDWCELCNEEYREYHLAVLPQWATLTVGSAYGLLVACFGFVSSGSAAARTVSTVAVAAMVAMVLWIGRHALKRKRFRRTRPERINARAHILRRTVDSPALRSLDALPANDNVADPSELTPPAPSATLQHEQLFREALSIPAASSPEPPPDSSVQANAAGARESGPEPGDWRPHNVELDTDAVSEAEQIRWTRSLAPTSFRPLPSMRPSARPSAMNLTRSRGRDQQRFHHALRKKRRDSVRRTDTPSSSNK